MGAKGAKRALGGLGGFMVNQHRLDHDFLRQIGTQAHAHIADLTDDAGALSQQPHLVFLTQTHFPEAMIDLGWSRKALDAHTRALFDLTQGAG